MPIVHRRDSSKLLHTVAKESHLDTRMDTPPEPSTSSAPRIYDAEAPYNHDDADLILRSCDNVRVLPQSSSHPLIKSTFTVGGLPCTSCDGLKSI